MKRCKQIINSFFTAFFITLMVLASPGAWAAEVSLPGSEFEIDVDADLIVDEGLTFDWANVAEDRREDLPSGSATDDAFGQGTSEDTEPPSPRFGGIPPNKSDLKFFGVYLEENLSGKFLHLFWTRVQDPSGTTLMDFEFNQSDVISANGVTPVRTSGDLLILYELSGGGTNPNLFLSRWLDGTEGLPCEASNKFPCWGEKTALGIGATGSINTSAIPAGDSDGLGALDPRTFGEASIDLDIIFDPSECTSFGSAYLKSRSSDSFTAALKDFIAPQTVNISNCGRVKITKEDDTGTALQGAEFTLFVDAAPIGGAEPGVEDDVVFDTCTTAANGMCTIFDVLAGNYWLVETVTPAGHETADPQAITVTADELVQVTFVNDRIPAKINIHKEDDLGADLAGAEFSLYVDNVVVGVFDAADTAVAGQTCTTDANGDCMISGILPPGNYCVVETKTPTGHETADPQCITLTLEQTVDLTFVDDRKPAKINIHKEDDTGAALAGATFTLYVDNPAVGVFDAATDTTTGKICVTDVSGNCMISNILPPGNYCVVETTTPTGHETADPQCITLALEETVNLTFVDDRKPAKINIHKEDDAGTALSGAEFTLYVDNAEIGVFLAPPDTSTGKTCTTNASGDCMISNILPPGNYCVVETVTPQNHDTADPQCISLALDQTVNLTFVNPRKRGAILITKTRKHKAGGGADQPHPGVTFKVNGQSGVTDNNGQVCFGDLLFDTYQVTETLPTGYVAEGNLTKNVDVDTKSTCGDGNEAQVSFANIPLTDIFVQVNSQVSGGTASTINCTGTDGPWTSGGFKENPSLDIDDLKPGTYTCTIVIDP